MNKLSATVATLLVAVAATSAQAADPKPEDYGVFLAPQAQQQSTQTREAVRAQVQQRARTESWYAERNPANSGVFLPTTQQPQVSEPVRAQAPKARADVRAEYNPADYGVFLAPAAKEAQPQYAQAK
jgi:opacity protein-like surface antigen